MKQKRSNWRDALARTRKVTLGRLATLFGATEITDAFWDELEATLIQADMGIDLVDELIESMQAAVHEEGITDGDELRAALMHALLQRLDNPASRSEIKQSPHVVILVGVNGSGKTTAVARLANFYIEQGKSVLLAAADTYRAAAAEQLALWGQQLDINVISGQPGSDPGAVVYDAAQAAEARKIDVLLVDTSGRMHTQHNLMAELQKVCRVAGKVIDSAPHEILLVLDATTGQNGLAQAQAFTQAVGLTGVILAKLDSSAKGGVAFAVAEQLALPITYVGLGEQADDFAAFNPEAYVQGLLAD